MKKGMKPPIERKDSGQNSGGGINRVVDCIHDDRGVAALLNIKATSKNLNF